MFDLLKNSLIDFRTTYKKYLVFEFIYLIITSFIFVPLIAIIFNRALRAMGTTSLLNSDIFKIMLDIRGILGLIIIGILSVIIIFIEFGVLTIISQKKYFRKDVSIIDAFITMIQKTPKILGFGIIQLMFLLLFLIPFIEMPLTSTLIQNIDIPAFMMQKIFNSNIFLALYFIGLLLVVYIFLRWIFTLHCIIIEDKTTREAIKRSLEMTKQNETGTIVKLFALNIVLFVIGLIIISSITFIPSILGFQINFVENYLITLSSFMAYIFALMLTPINIIIITRLYYQYNLKQGNSTEDTLITANFSKCNKVEEKVFSFFQKRRQLFIFVLLINLIVTVQVNYAVTDEFINVGRSIHVVSHRGDLHSAPENSLSAIRFALEKEVDFIEIDVQQTKDGVVVLNHDIGLERVAGIPYNVYDLNYDELSRIDIGRLYSNDFIGERIPTLEEALKEINGNIRVLIDLKPYGPRNDLAKKVVEIIVSHDMVNDSYVQAFNHSILAEIRRENDNIKIGQILYLAAGNLSYLDLDFYTVDKNMLSNNFIRSARSNDREIFVWTVNTESDIKEVLRYDINGIITDYPERVKNIIEIRLIEQQS